MSALALSEFLISLFEDSKDKVKLEMGPRKSTSTFNQSIVAFKKHKTGEPDSGTGPLELKRLIYQVSELYGNASEASSETKTPVTTVEPLGDPRLDPSQKCLKLMLEKIISAPGCYPYLIHLALAASIGTQRENKAIDSWFQEYQERAEYQLDTFAIPDRTSQANSLDDRCLFGIRSTPIKPLEKVEYWSKTSAQQKTPIWTEKSSLGVQDRQHFDDYMINSDSLERVDKSRSSSTVNTPSLCLEDDTLEDTPHPCSSPKDDGSDFTPLRSRIPKHFSRLEATARTLSTLLRPDPSTPNSNQNHPSSPFDVLMSLPRPKSPSPIPKQLLFTRPAAPDQVQASTNPSTRRINITRPERDRHVYHAPRTAVPNFFPPGSSSPLVPSLAKPRRGFTPEARRYEMSEDDEAEDSPDELF
jgi:hypothetical protein